MKARNSLSRVLLTAVLATACAAAAAQDLHHSVEAPSEDYLLKADTIRVVNYGGLRENLFLGLHLGVNGAWGENIRIQRITEYPKFLRLGGMASVGKFFTPAFGLRGSLGLYRQCGIAEKEPRETYPEYYGNGIYSFWNANANADVLVNLYHLFYPHRKDAKFNVMPLFGVGVSSTFGFTKSKIERFAQAPAPYVVQTKTDIYPSLRAGLLLSYTLNSRFMLELEAHYDATDDQYNGIVYDRKYDGYAVAMIGLAYSFHHGSNTYSSRKGGGYIELNDAEEVMKVNATLEEARRKVAYEEQAAVDTTERVVQEQILQMTVSFAIDKFNITEVQRPNVEAVAAYINAHPDVDVVICGFADVKTAYPAYNMRLSKRRVTAVFNMLTQQYGVDPKRLNIDYKGDTEQPYVVKNRWNRVVIFKLTPHSEYLDEE